MAKIFKTPTLETKRLILKQPTIEDAPAIQTHFNNWNIIKNLLDTVPWPYPDDGAHTFLKDSILPRVASGDALLWALRLKEKPNNPIGLIEFRKNPIDRDDNRGFWLAEPYWKQGFMTEAVSRVNDYIFEELNIQRIVICNFEGNEGSRRVKQKTGAKFISICEKPHHEGKIKSEIWELTAENWKKFKKNNSE